MLASALVDVGSSAATRVPSRQATSPRSKATPALRITSFQGALLGIAALKRWGGVGRANP